MKVKFGPQTLIYPMPSVLVGAVVGGKPNFMTAAWCSIASHKPPAVAVALHKKRYTLEGIRNTKVFSINIPSSSMAAKVDYCGLYSGRNNDKSEIFELFQGDNKDIPLIKDCPVNLECSLLNILEIGSHVLVIGEITESYIAEECLVDQLPDPLKIDPLIYSPKARTYHRLGEVVGRAFHMGKKA